MSKGLKRILIEIVYLPFQEYCISELHKLNNKEDMVALESNEDALSAGGRKRKKTKKRNSRTKKKKSLKKKSFKNKRKRTRRR